MIDALYGFTMSSMPNGLVLVTGGLDSSFSLLNHAELYDPVSHTWAATASMSVPRWGHAATFTSAFGGVMVTGGVTGFDPVLGQYLDTSSTEVYHPASGTWTSTGSLATARDSHTETEVNGAIVVAGGIARASGASSPLSSTESYGSPSNTWLPQPPLNSARYGHTATVVQGNGSQDLLVAGGFGESPTTCCATLATSEIYHGGNWTNSQGSMAAARGDHTATRLPDGRVLVAGGWDLSSSATFPTQAEIYDPSSQLWSSGGTIGPRASHAAALQANGAPIIAGGFYGAYPNTTYLATTQVYDSVTNTWLNGPTMSTPRAYFQAALAPDNTVLAAAGFNSGTTLSATSEFLALASSGAACSSNTDCLSGNCSSGVCTSGTPWLGTGDLSRILFVDSSWMRVGGAPGQFDNSTDFLSWINAHPRMAGRVRFRGAGIISRSASSLANATNLPKAGPTNVTVARLISDIDPSMDRLFIYAPTGSGPAIQSIGALDTATPVVKWTQLINAPVDGGGIEFSVDGATVYTVSSAGTVYAIATADVVQSRVLWSTSVGASVSWSAPWVDYLDAGAIYVADLAGNLTEIGAATGSRINQIPVDATTRAAIHSSPIVDNFVVWVGTDNGSLYRFDGNLTPIGMPTSLCLGTCDAVFDPIWSSPFIDHAHSQVFIGVNNQIAQMRLDQTTNSITGTSSTGCVQTASGVAPCAVTMTSMPGSYHNTGIFTSSPLIDPTAGQNFLYAAYRGRLTRFPFSVDSTVTPPLVAIGVGTNIQTSSASTPFTGDFSFPFSSPFMWPGHDVFIGDGDGYLADFQSTNSAFALRSATNVFSDPASGVVVTCTGIDSTVIDDLWPNGNAFFGCGGTTSPAGTPANQGAYVVFHH